jgi:hypothetical protein
MLYEVYDPASARASAAPAAVGVKPGMQVLTSIEFLQGTTKVFETPLVEANSLNVPGRGAVAFAFDIPLDRLTAGLYICQVNIIDDAGGSFSFPRQALLVRAAAVASTAPTPGAAPASPAAAPASDAHAPSL